VCEENDLRRALETARSFHPDLILLDLIMPQADGTEVAAQITSDWMLHNVPIVFVTALITQEEARDGRRIEGHRVVPKPGHRSELIKVVEESSKPIQPLEPARGETKIFMDPAHEAGGSPTSSHSSSITSGQSGATIPNGGLQTTSRVGLLKD
jgi:CheY-like chemotaxis protein